MNTPEKNQMFMTGRRYGVDVNCSSPAQAMKELEALRDSGKRHYVCFLEGNLLFQVIRNREVRRVLNEASLVYPDGIAIYFNWSLHFRRKFRD